MPEVRGENWFVALAGAADEARWLAALTDVPEAALHGLLRRHGLPDVERRSERIEAVRQALTAGTLTRAGFESWRRDVEDAMAAVDGLDDFRQRADIAKAYQGRHELEGKDLDAIKQNIRNAIWRTDLTLADWVVFLDGYRHLLDRNLFLYRIPALQLPELQRWRDPAALAAVRRKHGLVELPDTQRYEWRPDAPALIRMSRDESNDLVSFTWASWRQWTLDDKSIEEKRCLSFVRLSLATGDLELQLPHFERGGMRSLRSERDRQMRAVTDLLGIAPALMPLETAMRALMEDDRFNLLSWRVRRIRGGIVSGKREERLFDRVKPGLGRYYALELTGEWTAAPDRTLTIDLDARTDAITIKEQCEPAAAATLLAGMRAHAGGDGEPAPAATPARNASDAESRALVARIVEYERQLGRTHVNVNRLASKDATNDLLFSAPELRHALEQAGVRHADATFVIWCPETKRPVQEGGVELQYDRPSEVPKYVLCENVPESPHRLSTKGHVRLQVGRPRPETHVVMLLHGIRTQGEWEDRAAATLRTAPITRVVPMRYFFFDAVRFLLPIRSVRQRPVRRIEVLIRDELSKKPAPDHLSIVAHSFGTFIVAGILEDQTDIKLYRLILCGSIIPEAFAWNRFPHRFAPEDTVEWQVVNDCGSLDRWPVLAQWVTWGYGASGRFGFGHPRVKDRYHAVGHSGFFAERFMRKYWLPYLADGTIVEGETNRPTTSWWLSLLTVVKLPYVLATGVVVGVVVWLLALGRQ